MASSHRAVVAEQEYEVWEKVLSLSWLLPGRKRALDCRVAAAVTLSFRLHPRVWVVFV